MEKNTTKNKKKSPFLDVSLYALLGLTGLTATQGCRIPSVQMKQEHEKIFSGFTKGTLNNESLDNYVEDLFNEPKTTGQDYKFDNVESTFKSFFKDVDSINGDHAYNDLLAVDGIYDLTRDINKGIHLVAIDMQKKKYGLSGDLESKLGPNKEFTAEQQRLVDNARHKLKVDLLNRLSNFQYSQHTRLKEAAGLLKEKHPELSGDILSLLDSNNKELKHLQSRVKGGVYLLAAAGDYTDSNNLAMIDNQIERAVTGTSYTESAESIFNRKVNHNNKETTLQKLLDDYINDVRGHFEKRDQNHLDDIWRKRYHVANTSWKLHANKKEISPKEHQGVLYTISNRLAEVAQTPYNSSYNILSTLARIVPFFGSATDFVGNQAGYLGAPEKPGDTTKQIYKRIFADYPGASLGEYYVGNKGEVKTQALLNFVNLGLSTALWYKGSMNGEKSGSPTPPPIGQTGNGGEGFGSPGGN